MPECAVSGIPALDKTYAYKGEQPSKSDPARCGALMTDSANEDHVDGQICGYQWADRERIYYFRRTECCYGVKESGRNSERDSPSCADGQHWQQNYKSNGEHLHAVPFCDEPSQ